MKQSEEKYQDIKIEKPSWVQQFFILCSGADKNILFQCRTEWNKYSGIGATIFLTACLAVLSGGYAMMFVFDSPIIAIVFGLFWGVVIFNLDRYIVLSLRKEKIPTKTEIHSTNDPLKKEEKRLERKRLLLNQVYMASPRFFIALIIAVTVSKPIELRMFDKRINKELNVIQRADIAACETEFSRKLEEQNNKLDALHTQQAKEKTTLYSQNPIYNGLITDIRNIDTKISTLQQEKSSNDKEIPKNKYQDPNDLKPVYKTEVIGGKPTKVQTGWEPKWKYNQKAIDLQKRNAAIEKELTLLKEELKNKKLDKKSIETSFVAEEGKINAKFDSLRAPIFSEISRLNSEKPAFIARCQQTALASADLAARLEALGNISLFSFKPSDKNFLGNSIWWTSFVIMLLFIVLETAPVVVKLLTKRGPYDEILDRIEYEHYINETELISRWNSKINELLEKAREAAKLEGETFIQVEKQRLEHELRNNQKILDDLAQKQEHLAKIAIDKWYQDELAKANSGSINQSNKSVSPKLENIFWKQVGASDKIEYCFRNGSVTNNELLYFENEQLTKGKWNFVSTAKDEIKIELPDISIEYLITELTSDTLKLKEKGTNDIIELKKI